MSRKIVAAVAFAGISAGLYWLHALRWGCVWLGPGHSLWEFLSIACALLAVRYAAAVAIARYIRWRHGPEGESQMLSGFVGVMAWLAIIAGFIYSLGLLGPSAAWRPSSRARCSAGRSKPP